MPSFPEFVFSLFTVDITKKLPRLPRLPNQPSPLICVKAKPSMLVCLQLGQDPLSTQ